MTAHGGEQHGQGLRPPAASHPRPSTSSSMAPATRTTCCTGGVVGQDASKGNPFPQGAVQEFRVITQNYKAEYQKAASAIITATTRSGSNQWEGDAFAFGVGKSYVARDAFIARRAATRGLTTSACRPAAASAGRSRRTSCSSSARTSSTRATSRNTCGSAATRSFAPPALVSSLQPLTGQFDQRVPRAPRIRQAHVGEVRAQHRGRERHASQGHRFPRLRRTDELPGAPRTWTSTSTPASRTGGTPADRWLNEAQVNVQHFTWGPTPEVHDTDRWRTTRTCCASVARMRSQDFTQNRISLRDDVTRIGGSIGAATTRSRAARTWTSSTYEAMKDQQATPVFRFRKDERLRAAIRGACTASAIRTVKHRQPAVRRLRPG